MRISVKILFIHSFISLFSAMMGLLQDSSSFDSESDISMSTAVSSSSSDSVPSILTSGSLSDSTSLKSLCAQKSPSCYYDPSTCQYQSFSIPEKIVFYIAKNCTNATTFQKLIETCKYFFKINPVIVVPELKSDVYELSGSAYYRWSVNNHEKPCFQFKNPQRLNFKIWLIETFVTHHLGVSQLIPKIYRNDATYVGLGTNDQIISWEEFMFIAGNAERLYLSNETIKYEEGEFVTLERIVESLPKLKYLQYASNGDGSDITSTTFTKFTEIEHFYNITLLNIYNVPEELNVETMFNFIFENKHIEINICYRSNITVECKERIQEYSNQLKNEDGCKSSISYFETYYGVGDDVSIVSSFEENISSGDNASDIFDDSDLLFPWNNEDEEGWEVPWDI